MGFDIANHFCEYAGFAITPEDFVTNYPDEHAASHFFRAYFRATGESIPNSEHMPGVSEASSELTTGASDSDPVTKVFFSQLYDIVAKYSLASHLFW